MASSVCDWMIKEENWKNDDKQSETYVNLSHKIAFFTSTDQIFIHSFICLGTLLIHKHATDEHATRNSPF